MNHWLTNDFTTTWYEVQCLRIVHSHIAIWLPLTLISIEAIEVSRSIVKKDTRLVKLRENSGRFVL